MKIKFKLKQDFHRFCADAPGMNIQILVALDRRNVVSVPKLEDEQVEQIERDYSAKISDEYQYKLMW